MSESITKELRDCIFYCPHLKGVADRIDARIDRELTAKRDEMDGLKADNAKLQAKLDSSIPAPLDADGMPWTGREDEFIADTDERCRLLGVLHSVEGGDFLEVDDGSGRYFIADACHHVAPEPPETIEDVRKSCDNTVSYLASVSGMGWHDVETFSKDVHKQLDRAYACGKRDGAGEQS